MSFKTLRLTDNLQEYITYNSHFPALSTCIDHFDDYFQQEWSVHWHDDFEFGIVQKGYLEFTVHDGQNRIVHKLRKGDGIFIGSGYLHSAKGLEPDTILAGVALPINFFNTSIFENVFHRYIRPLIESEIACIDLHMTDSDDQPLLSGIQELSTISEQEPAYEFHFIEAVCKICRFLIIRAEQDGSTRFSAENKLQEQRVKKMLSFIHAHFGEHISINDMARSAAISRTECFRCFQTILGKSPVEYLTEYRLSMAISMLTNSERTLSEISYLCGFSSPSYFGKVFRERCGTSPQKYKKQICGSHKNHMI